MDKKGENFRCGERFLLLFIDKVEDCQSGAVLFGRFMGPEGPLGRPFHPMTDAIKGLQVGPSKGSDLGPTEVQPPWN